MKITVLFTQAGSMSGRIKPIVDKIKNIIDNCNMNSIPISVYGHTADTQGQELVMIPYIDFEGNVVNDIATARAIANNNDGAAIRFVANHLDPSAENFVIIFTDKEPCCRSFQGNDGIKDVTEALNILKRKSTVTTFAPKYVSKLDTLNNIYGGIIPI